MKQVLTVLATLLMLYLAITFYFYANQKDFIYFPNNEQFEDCQGGQQLTINGTRALFVEGTTDTVIVHYHGNAGTACQSTFTKEYFAPHNILYVEYTGYAGDTKEPNIQDILQDVRNIHTYTKTFNRTIVFGQSLGSGPASYHAHLGHVHKVILSAPLYSLSHQAKQTYWWLPVDIILTENYTPHIWLQHTNASILLLHGKNDNLVKPISSEKLAQELNVEKKLVDAGHNDLWENTEYVQHIKDSVLFHVTSFSTS